MKLKPFIIEHEAFETSYLHDEAVKEREPEAHLLLDFATSAGLETPTTPAPLEDSETAM